MDKRVRFFVFVVLMLLTVFSYAAADDAIEVHIHNYQSEPFTDKIGQDVSLFLSVTSADGSTISGLEQKNFRVFEDSAEQQISSVTSAGDEPVKFMLLIDNSQSIGGYLPDITKAAGQFLEKFDISDEGAVIKFNEKKDLIQDFTSNHSISSRLVKEISGELRTGTCIYDTVYDSLLMLSEKEPGHRSVILLTDGKDEKFADNSICSVHSRDEVTKLSQSESIPVYIIGFGKNTAELELRALASGSGGVYLPAEDLSNVSEALDKIYRVLENEYKVSYDSKSSGGSRNIVVEVNKDNSYSRDTKIVKLPESPTVMFFQTPSDGDTLQSEAELSVGFLQLNEKIANVKYSYKGAVIGESVAYPYSYRWDIRTIAPEQNAALEAVCFDKNGAELARDTVRVNIAEPPLGEIIFSSPASGESVQGVVPIRIEFSGLTRDVARVEYYVNGKFLDKAVNEPFTYEWDVREIPAGTADITAVAYDRENVEAARGSQSFMVEEIPVEKKTSVWPVLAFSVIGILVLGILAVIFVPKIKKQPEKTAAETAEPEEGPDEIERTSYGFMSSSVDSDALATLEVITCDDTPLIGSLYNVLQLPLSIGRSADNDLVFSSKETSVSRHHAQLEAMNGNIYIRDMNSTYGTFVNNRPVNNDSARLQTGDIIRLGKKVQLRFNRILNSDGGSEDETKGGFRLEHATLKVDTERWKLLK